MNLGAQRSPDPWIELAGADNIRHLGGLPTTSGGRTTAGLLLRSGTLQDLTPAAVRHLVDDLGLKTVIDLRVPAEAEREGSALAGEPGLTYLSLPIRTADSSRSDAVADVRDMDVVDHYRSYLVASGESIVAAARVFATSAYLPVVFHCAAGKDRTGVLAAVVLDTVGVEPAAIVADYALTAERIERIRAHLSQLDTYREMQAVIRRGGGGMSAAGGEMQRFLDHLHAEYGGGAGYLAANGMTAAELDALREALVEPA